MRRFWLFWLPAAAAVSCYVCSGRHVTSRGRTRQMTAGARPSVSEHGTPETGPDSAASGQFALLSQPARTVV